MDLTRKLGPLPTWAWMGIGGTGIALLMLSTRGASNPTIYDSSGGNGNGSNGNSGNNNNGGNNGGSGGNGGTAPPPVDNRPTTPTLPELFSVIGTFFSGDGPKPAYYIGDSDPAGWQYVGMFNGLRGFIRIPEAPRVTTPPAPGSGTYVPPPVVGTNPGPGTGTGVGGGGRANGGGSVNTLIRNVIGWFPVRGGLVNVYDVGGDGYIPIGLYYRNGQQVIGYVQSIANPNNVTGASFPAALLQFLQMNPLTEVPRSLWPAGWSPTMLG